MVQMHTHSLVYEDIQKRVTDEIMQNNLKKYLWGKNPHWNDTIFDSIDWKAMYHLAQ